MSEKGSKALRGYLEFYKDTWPRNIKNEYRIDGISLLIPHNGEELVVPLKGSLDKIEFNDNGTVNVVDYKTGKSKSRNALLGLTKDNDLNYLRQLTFYKLLLGKFEKEQFVMNTGTIEFIEPSEGGKYVRESFEITDDQVTELESVAKDVAISIYDLSFWGKRCAQKECEYCDLYANLMSVTT
jgi:hypothetical protein